MRKYKLRVWDKSDKVMIYNAETTYDANVEGYDAYVAVGCFGDFLDDDDFIVMQSTGVMDRNKKEIYEGDVIKDSKGTRIYSTILVEAKYNFDPSDDIEIIGNMCENTIENS